MEDAVLEALVLEDLRKKLQVTAYCVRDVSLIAVTSRDGRTLWKIQTRDGWVINNKGEVECEPLPSSRDDEFLARTRFDSVDACLRLLASLGG